MSGVFSDPDWARNNICEYAGHEYADAGGGLLICTVCEDEKWGEEEDPILPDFPMYSDEDFG